MSKDPAVLFYTADYLTGTRLMSYEQKGKYMDLLCLQHQQGPLSEQDMLDICNGYDERIFSKFKRNEQGLYYNERMEEERLKRQNYSLSRSQNGKKGGRPKKHMESICLPYEKHSENDNNNITTTTNIDLQTNIARTREENVENSNVENSNVENFSERVVGENFDEEIVEFFEKEELSGDPRDFYAFNQARNWLGVGGEDLLLHDTWQRYAYKWSEAYTLRSKS